MICFEQSVFEQSYLSQAISHILQGSQVLCGLFASPFTIPIVLPQSPTVLSTSISCIPTDRLLSSVSFALDLLFDRCTQMAIVRQATITKMAKTIRIAAPAAVLSFLSDVGLVDWGGSSEFVRARRCEGREKSCDGGIVMWISLKCL